MNKNIFDETLQKLRYATVDLEDLEIIHSYDVSKIEKVVIKAQKQEKLLGLYKKLNEVYKELITLARYNSWSWDLDLEIIDLNKQIKELENEKRK